MWLRLLRRSVLFCLVALCISAAASAASVNVAVSANFHATLKRLARVYQKQTGDRIATSVGSTGKLYAQIRNGAPFGLFLAADVRRPRLLEEKGLIVPASRFTYAVGQLALWSPDKGFVGDGPGALTSKQYDHLAIANPTTAPYGAAAKETLQKLGLYKKLQPRIVQGQNIGQTFGFVITGNAKLGFVALSQVLNPANPAGGDYWLVPSGDHHRIAQQAVVLKSAQNRQAVDRFVDFLKTPAAAKIIHNYGYATPDGQ